MWIAYNIPDYGQERELAWASTGLAVRATAPFRSIFFSLVQITRPVSLSRKKDRSGPAPDRYHESFAILGP
jgi:hypothetical protein